MKVDFRIIVNNSSITVQKGTYERTNFNLKERKKKSVKVSPERLLYCIFYVEMLWILDVKTCVLVVVCCCYCCSTSILSHFLPFILFETNAINSFLCTSSLLTLGLWIMFLFLWMREKNKHPWIIYIGFK